MPRPSQTHPYSDRGTFERLLILIATLAQYPGVGCPDPHETRDDHHNALTLVQTQWQEVAHQLELKESNPPSTHTIERDLKLLKQYGILQNRMYRWGYYLGTGALTPDELRLALNAIETMAQDQGDSLYRQVHRRLTQRLKGFQFHHNQNYYPVRRNLNQPVNWTDHDELLEKRLIEKGKVAPNLFQELATVETAILQGQALGLYRRKSVYESKHVGAMEVWPLQIIYYNIAWYLLFENCQDGCLAIGRINRFSEQVESLNQTRSLEQQRHSLTQAHKLLSWGWGLKLGNVEDQRLELARTLPLLDIKVRFTYPGSQFILEGDKRHPTLKLSPSPIHDPEGNPTYVDFKIKLPPRSLEEFHLWMVKYGAAVKVISPPTLKQKHGEWVRQLAQHHGLISPGN